jgi:hypothetical protein
LVGVTIEQDSAYWEIQIDIPGDDSSGTAYEIMCGVATKKDRKFYDALQEQEEGTIIFDINHHGDIHRSSIVRCRFIVIFHPSNISIQYSGESKTCCIRDSRQERHGSDAKNRSQT